MNYVNIHLKGLLANQMFCVSALFVMLEAQSYTDCKKQSNIKKP